MRNGPELVGATWHKSTYSSSGNDACIEVAQNLPGLVAVRDSTDPNGPRLACTPRAWQSLTGRIKDGTLTL